MPVCLSRLQQRPITWQPWQHPKISITRTWRKWVQLHVKEWMYLFPDLSTKEGWITLLYSNKKWLVMFIWSWPQTFCLKSLFSVSSLIRFVGETCPMWLLILWRKSITFSSGRLFTSSPRPRRWADKSFVTVTKHSWKRSWRKCGCHSASTMR